MPVMQAIIDNPWKILLGSSGTIITLVGALFTIDARYAHAADTEQDNKDVRAFVQQSVQDLRRQMLEDKLFELDMKKAQAPNGKNSPVDEALRDRYQRQLRELRASNK